MLLALILATGSALLGGALALAVRKRAPLLELTRTFAFAAAAGVVALHLLPEALEAIGAKGLLWAAVGFALPGLLEWRARSLSPAFRGKGFSPARVAAEVGLLALVAHSLLEGVALSAAASGNGSHVDLEIALVAHHAPLTAAVILPFLGLVSARGVALRVLSVAAAGGLGAILGGVVPAALSTGLPQDIASAVMAGALLHVVADEIRPQPKGPSWLRAIDLLAAAVGFGIALVSAIFGGAALGEDVRGLLIVAITVSPMLLLADALLAVPRAPVRWVQNFPLAAQLILLGTLGPWAALTGLVLAIGLTGLAAFFAPGEARLQTRPATWAGRLLAIAGERGPERVLAFPLAMAGMAGLVAWIDALHLGPFGSSLLLASALFAFSALSPAAAALLASVYVHVSPHTQAGFDYQPWASPSLLVCAVCGAPFLLTREAWRGGWKRRWVPALLTVFVVASAAIILYSGPFDGTVREQRATLAALWSGARGHHFFLAVSGLSVLALGGLTAAALWRSGVRGFFVPLRPGHPRDPREAEGAVSQQTGADFAPVT